MIILSKEYIIKILLGIACCIVITVIFLLLFGFENDYNKQKIKIGLITIGDIREPGWNANHYNGIKTAAEEFGIEVIVRDNIGENTGKCAIAIKELAEEGVGMIFLASGGYAKEVEDVIKEYHNIEFATNYSEVEIKNLSAYFARMFQGRYLSGALAGMRTKTNVIGYVAGMPNSEVLRGINAFALGVQKINPNAKVVVMWTNDWDDPKIEKLHAKRLIEEANADVLTYHQAGASTIEVADSLGVDSIGYNILLDGYSEHYLTSVTCKWDVYYKELIQRYLKGELNSVKNSWFGIDRGIVMLSRYSSAVTPEMKLKIDELKQTLLDDHLIFSGEIYDNQGNLKCSKDDAISDDKLLERTDWLLRGVEVLE